MSMFSSLTSNPADAAMKYYSQIPDVLQQYLSPYIDAGTDSLNMLTGQYKDLVTDPGAKFSQLTSGFEDSPGYQYQYNQGQNAASNAAAAGGGTGGSQHMEDAAKMSSNLADQEYQQYAKNVLGLYGEGLGGESDINKIGAQMSGDMAQGLSSNLATEGNMAAASAAGKNNMIGGLIGDAGEALGYALGGPIGGMSAGAVTGGLTGSGGPGSLGSAIGGMPTSASGAMTPEMGYGMALKKLFSYL